MNGNWLFLIGWYDERIGSKLKAATIDFFAFFEYASAIGGVSNKLKGYNFVTGLLEMPLEKSLVYNSILLAFYGFYSIFIDIFSFPYRIPIEFIICLISIVIIWYIYYFNTLYYHKNQITSILQKAVWLHTPDIRSIPQKK